LFYLFLNPVTLNSLFKGVIASAGQSGSSATVSYNPINRLAMQLDQKEKELNQRGDRIKRSRKNILEKIVFFIKSQFRYFF